MTFNQNSMVQCTTPELCSSPDVPAQTDIARMSGAGNDIRKIMIVDGIYQFMTMRDSCMRTLNSGVIVNEKDVLVFDTNTRPSSARIILGEIKKITDKPVRQRSLCESVPWP